MQGRKSWSSRAAASCSGLATLFVPKSQGRGFGGRQTKASCSFSRIHGMFLEAEKHEGSWGVSWRWLLGAAARVADLGKRLAYVWKVVASGIAEVQEIFEWFSRDYFNEGGVVYYFCTPCRSYVHRFEGDDCGCWVKRAFISYFWGLRQSLKLLNWSLVLVRPLQRRAGTSVSSYALAPHVEIISGECFCVFASALSFRFLLTRKLERWSYHCLPWRLGWGQISKSGEILE